MRSPAEPEPDHASGPDADEPLRRRLESLLAAATVGPTRLGPGAADDGAPLLTALAALGVSMRRLADGAVEVRGLGLGGLLEPASPLDLAGDAAGGLLLVGLLAATPIAVAVVLPEDAEVEPLLHRLETTGAILALSRRDGRRILTTRAATIPLPVRHVGPLSGPTEALALLLAGLGAPGETTVPLVDGLDDALESIRAFGAAVIVDADGATVTGRPELAPPGSATSRRP